MSNGKEYCAPIESAIDFKRTSSHRDAGDRRENIRAYRLGGWAISSGNGLSEIHYLIRGDAVGAGVQRSSLCDG